ncbi:SGNH/GDSL hydrolase family protein [Solicola gregarius]|uniref:SGNH/GDSL hydrolase family protein n=1 Tax=Solicola gregarius TaxID=2908642 RepID=A0AA46THA6_9ACTN|nr:SGNH/GDSL hydrolase family protein [Solicola gregarius]UYM04493.1 SGNH/GDSL hydrolase family protein [Solicola gregarius]
MIRPSLRKLGALGVGLLVATVPLSATSTAADRPGPSTRAPAYGEYVAMGDSYTAGPLIPKMRDDPAGCLRSTHNYPARLAKYLDVGSYVDVSCSGARSTHLRKPQSISGGENAPQLDALSADTELVTLGIGGNDFGLFGSLLAKCPELAKKNPDGAPCKKWFGRSGVDVKKRAAERVRPRIDRALADIRERSPQADIVVVGYLRILPVDGDYCRKLVPFAKGDYRWGNSIERALNTSLRTAAKDAGAKYVGMYPASRGHTACDGKRAWVNGQYININKAASYHPFGKGMRGIARQAYWTITD